MFSNKIFRLLTIVNILSENKDGLSKNEIIEIVERKYALKNNPLKYLDLTFKRDLRDIRNELQIDIRYSKKTDCYFLDTIETDEKTIGLMLNSFKIFTTLLQHSSMPNYVIAENRKSNGLQHFTTISEGISKQQYIEFSYFKYDADLLEQKKIKPFVLKESKNRWYVIGSYENQTEIRSFGLDRISKLSITEQRFKQKVPIDSINSLYKDSFAMFTNEKTEIVILKFDLRDGNYIKSYPIHHSQKIEIEENNSAYIITLQIKTTLDFIMELMSRAWSLEVIAPLHLRSNVQHIFAKAAARNQHL